MIHSNKRITKALICQTGQMCRLVRAFVVRKLLMTGFLALMHILKSKRQTVSQVWINNNFHRKIVNVFLPISFNICFGSFEFLVLLSTHNICFG